MTAVPFDREDVGILAFFLGATLVIFGLWLAYVPAGFVAGGIFLAVVGISVMRA